MKDQVRDILVSQGFVSASAIDYKCTNFVAYKNFDTSVGVKEALIYFTEISGGWKLFGNYYSEGINVIVNQVILFKSGDDIETLVCKFANDVTRKIDQSYARKLHLNKEN